MLIIICGPSTVGKDSVWIPAAEQLNFIRYVPYTSRKIRPNETNGKDYNFISVQEFQERIHANEFLEWDFFHGNYYGTHRNIISHLKNDNIVMHSLFKMAFRIKKQINDTLIVSLIASNIDTIKQRLKNRGYNKKDLVIRLSHLEEENLHSALADLIVKNAENIDSAEAMNILSKELNLTRRST